MTLAILGLQALLPAQLMPDVEHADWIERLRKRRAEEMARFKKILESESDDDEKRRRETVADPDDDDDELEEDESEKWSEPTDDDEYYEY